MRDARELTPEQAGSWKAFMQMQEVLRSRLEQQLQATSKLSNADYTVLVELSEAPERRFRVYELGEVMGWEKSRLHHQLTRMCKRGLVRRERDPGASRAVQAVLTEEGLVAIAGAAPAHAREVQRLFYDRLNERQVAQLSTISHRVLDGLLPSETE